MRLRLSVVSRSLPFVRGLPGASASFDFFPFDHDAISVRIASTGGEISPCRQTSGVVMLASAFGIACRSTCVSGIASSTDSGTSAMPVPEATHATMAW